MKKNLYLQIWGMVCLLVVAFLMLTTTFHFSIVCDAEKFDKENSEIQNGEEYEMNQFCNLMEEREARGSNIIDWNGKLLETYGVGTDDTYDIISFTVDMLERVLDNLRFDLSALVADPFKNLFVYLFCLLLVGGGIGMFVKGFINNIMALWKAATKKDVETETKPSGYLAFCTPMITWLSVLIFRFYNSYSLKSVFEVENVISTKYTQGCSYLIMFIGAMAIYFIGYALISFICNKKINRDYGSIAS